MNSLTPKILSPGGLLNCADSCLVAEARYPTQSRSASLPVCEAARRVSSRHPGWRLTILRLRQGIRFLPPFAVLRRLRPALVGLARADQTQVGAEARVAGAGALARHAWVKADDAPPQFFGVRNVDHPLPCRCPQEGWFDIDDIGGGVNLNRVFHRRRPRL